MRELWDQTVNPQQWIPGAIATLIVLGFMCALWWVLTYGLPESGRDAALVMLGVLGSSMSAIVGYYFGSTSGSARKTELLAQAPPIQ